MIAHKGTQPLKTPRLTLRKFTPDDAPAMFETWACDERATRYLTWTPHETPEFTRALLEEWCAAYENPAAYNWIIEYKGTPIGSISVVRISEANEYADLGYCMGYQYWNQGFMPEAVKAVIDYLFAEVGFNRIGISHAVKNPASGRVAQKCGLKFEGIRREYFKTPSGEFLDISEYAILRSEWAACSS